MRKEAASSVHWLHLDFVFLGVGMKLQFLILFAVLSNVVACSSMSVWGDPTEGKYITQAYVLPEYQAKPKVEVTARKTAKRGIASTR